MSASEIVSQAGWFTWTLHRDYYVAATMQVLILVYRSVRQPSAWQCSAILEGKKGIPL